MSHVHVHQNKSTSSSLVIDYNHSWLTSLLSALNMWTLVMSFHFSPALCYLLLLTTKRKSPRLGKLVTCT